MTRHVQLGWRVPLCEWARFERSVAQKWGKTAGYLRFELQEAMREFLDEDDLLAEAETLLQRAETLGDASSSMVDARRSRQYRGAETRKVTHRIHPKLKARFIAYAEECNASSYGRLLAVALRAYRDGGRARRILDRIERAITNGEDEDHPSTKTTTTDETTASTPSENTDSTNTGTPAATDTAGTTTTPTPQRTTSPTVDAATVLEIATELADHNTIPQSRIDREIARTVSDRNAPTIQAYREAVIEQLDFVEHPHVEGLYLTPAQREAMPLWADFEKAERIVLTRRLLVADALRSNTVKHAVTYSELQELWAEYAVEGPSHQYAYELMEWAADEEGFAYRQVRGQYRLQVDVHSVSRSIIEWADEEFADVDSEGLQVTADVTSYSAGSTLRTTDSKSTSATDGPPSAPSTNPTSASGAAHRSTLEGGVPSDD